MTFFDENYSVVAVQSHQLVVRGVRSGTVLIINTIPETPLTEEDCPPGSLIALSTPATGLSS